MFSALLTELLKLRRSKMLLYVIMAGLIPALVKFLQYVFGENNRTVRWEWFIASNREIMVLCVLTAVVMVSAFIFSMEYQYSTASYIFTSSISRTKIFISKMVSLFAVIVLLLAVSACSDLIFGLLAFKEGLPADLMLKFIKAIGWYILSYFLLSTIIVMLAVFLKRFVLSAVIVLGYVMLVFPFHLKGNPYICPFMAPTIVATKILNSDNYFIGNYYKDITVNNLRVLTFLIGLAVISFIIGTVRYKKSAVM